MIDTKTFYAVAEIAQAAAHLSGFVGPVEFTICRPRNYDWCGVEDDPVSTESDSDRASFARVTEDEDYWDDDDGWCGDCGNCEDCWDEQMQFY